MTGRLEILYILGRGRSGSTFVENDLAQRNNLPLLGESRLWPMVYRDSHACSCGRPKTDCPFWAPVIDTLPDRAETEAAFRRLIRRKALLSILMPDALVRRVYAREIAAIGRFYGHLAQVHGLSRVIDSSKNPAFGRLLSLAPGLDVRFVHVVRHPLGVAFSWKRQRGSGSDHGLHQQVKSLPLAALEWAGSNLLSELAKWRVRGAHRTLRYEDLGDAALLQGVAQPLAPQGPEGRHAMAGNPSDASRQRQFRLDEDWKTGLSALEKAVCLAIAGPVLLFYRRRG